MAEMQRCQGCHRLIRLDDRYCPLCGTEQSLWSGAAAKIRFRDVLLVLVALAVAVAAIVDAGGLDFGQSITSLRQIRGQVGQPPLFRLSPRQDTGGNFTIGEQVVVGEQGARMYASMAGQTVLIAQLPSGTALTIVGSSIAEGDTAWWLVRDSHGRTGYVAADDLVPADTGNPQRSLPPRTIWINQPPFAAIGAAGRRTANTYEGVA